MKALLRTHTLQPASRATAAATAAARLLQHGDKCAAVGHILAHRADGARGRIATRRAASGCHRALSSVWPAHAAQQLLCAAGAVLGRRRRLGSGLQRRKRVEARRLSGRPPCATVAAQLLLMRAASAYEAAAAAE